MPASAEAVCVSVASLVKLAQPARGLSLRRGEIRSRKSDAYRSRMKGRGMEYDESRLYQAGDDVRHLDWRVTARTGKAHTKLFCEERERPVFLWVDCRAPMFFATRGRLKMVAAAETAALLAWSAAQEGDRVGGVVFSEEAHCELKPKRGRASVLRLIHELAACTALAPPNAGTPTSSPKSDQKSKPPKPTSPLKGSRSGAARPVEGDTQDGAGGHRGMTGKRRTSGLNPAAAPPGGDAVATRSAGQALLRLSHLVRPGSLVFIVSDFRGLGEASETAVRKLTSHNDVFFVFVSDPVEQQLPPPGDYRISDGLRDLRFDTGDAEFAETYAARFRTRLNRWRTVARKAGTGFLQCRTFENPLEVLKKDFGARLR